MALTTTGVVMTLTTRRRATSSCASTQNKKAKLFYESHIKNTGRSTPWRRRNQHHITRRAILRASVPTRGGGQPRGGLSRERMELVGGEVTGLRSWYNCPRANVTYDAQVTLLTVGGGRNETFSFLQLYPMMMMN